MSDETTGSELVRGSSMTAGHSMIAGTRSPPSQILPFLPRQSPL